MTRRQFRRLTSSSGPTLESLTRRKPSRRIFKDINGCKTIPPVPYPGFMSRFMLPTAIEDTEELQTAADWSTGNYKTHFATRTSPPAIEFLGDEVSCYVYTLTVPSGSGETKIVTQPIRWSVCETGTNGNDGEMWREFPNVFFPGGYEVQQLIQNVRPAPTVFSQDTWLPFSGDSHASATDPYQAGFLEDLFCCRAHVEYVYGDVISTVPLQIRRVAEWYAFGRHVQWRVNGSAVGPVHDLYDFRDQYPDGLGVYRHRYPFLQPFPSGDSTWINYQTLLENWNLQFDAGDTIEFDVWYEIAGKQVASGSRTLCFSIGRFCTNDSQQCSRDTTPTQSSGFSRPVLTGDAIFKPGILSLAGINMSPGFDPESHTYDFNPTDGQFEFGKAQADGAVSFAITSKRLNWIFNESAGGACGGTSTWGYGLDDDTNPVWTLITDDCEGGGVAVPPPGIPEIGQEETTSCDCSAAGSGDSWRFAVELVYEFELAYLKIVAQQLTGTPPLSNATLYYRPESMGDYVDELNDRWEGTMKTGPTGVFNHLGTTTFKIWHGVKQTSGAYPTGLPSVFSALSGILPTGFTVTKVAQ